MQSDQLERYIPKALVYAILWSFAGDGKLKSEMEHLYNINHIMFVLTRILYLFISSQRFG